MGQPFEALDRRTTGQGSTFQALERRTTGQAAFGVLERRTTGGAVAGGAVVASLKQTMACPPRKGE